MKFLPLLCLLLAACSTTTLDDRGDKVTIVDSISPTDLLTYERVTSLYSHGMRSIESCRNDLRNQAAKAGATVLRISSSEPANCAEDILSSGPKDCFNAHGDAYRPKSVDNAKH
jgi:hypothetical protein